MKMLILPAQEDPDHSVDVFDRDRRNEMGGYWCVAPSVLAYEALYCWDRYVEENSLDLEMMCQRRR